ncbi:uncharacterized protein B0H18DRAFT_1124951 [Fomitopsis serialis]|uniref:uncharacterized protein n=1 Tax=Fomitopsis serialis TaxID=139415 RepID=UPI002007DE61|nr:uncharacterized protein B0H18DRAFT_1124951 [Neoantrodia serialis]KAH9915362.1 hypothetical protein B0H18DRAFT_1124951 [Neoantrodia serialis]
MSFGFGRPLELKKFDDTTTGIQEELAALAQNMKSLRNDLWDLPGPDSDSTDPDTISPGRGLALLTLRDLVQILYYSCDLAGKLLRTLDADDPTQFLKPIYENTAGTLASTLGQLNDYERRMHYLERTGVVDIPRAFSVGAYRQHPGVSSKDGVVQDREPFPMYTELSATQITQIRKMDSASQVKRATEIHTEHVLSSPSYCPHGMMVCPNSKGACLLRNRGTLTCTADRTKESQPSQKLGPNQRRTRTHFAADWDSL